jgi:hypothetical protein
MTLEQWKIILNAKRAGENLDPPYESVRSYEQMPSEAKLLFDVLSDVLKALTEK